MNYNVIVEIEGEPLVSDCADFLSAFRRAKADASLRGYLPVVGFRKILTWTLDGKHPNDCADYVAVIGVRP